MKDEPIYYINQFSVFRRPRIWTKRGYWTFQILTSVIAAAILAAVLALEHLPVLFYLAVILTAAFIGASYNFLLGRRRAERYKLELATGGPTPFYGKYPLNEVAHLRRL